MIDFNEELETVGFFGGFRVKEGLFLGDVYAAKV